MSLTKQNSEHLVFSREAPENTISFETDSKEMLKNAMKMSTDLPFKKLLVKEKHYHWSDSSKKKNNNNF